MVQERSIGKRRFSRFVAESMLATSLIASPLPSPTLNSHTAESRFGMGQQPQQSETSQFPEQNKSIENGADVRREFSNFIHLLSSRLGQTTYAELYPNFNGLDNPNEESVLENHFRFWRKTYSTETDEVYGFTFSDDKHNSAAQGYNEKLSRSDLQLRRRLDPKGNVLGEFIEGNVNAAGILVERNQHQKESLSVDKLEEIAARIGGYPIASDEAERRMFEDGSIYIMRTLNGRTYSLQLWPHGEFVYSAVPVSIKTPYSHVYEQSHEVEVPQTIVERQDRVKRDFRDFTTDISTQIINQFESFDQDKKSLKITAGPHGKKRAAYKIFFLGHMDPSKKTGQYNDYSIETTVDINSDGNPDTSSTSSLKIEATSNAEGSYGIQLSQDASTGTDFGNITVYSENTGEHTGSLDVVLPTASFSGNPYEFFYTDTDTAYRTASPYIQVLDRLTFDALTQRFSQLFQAAQDGEEVKDIPSLLELKSLDILPSFTEFSAHAKQGDSTWSDIEEQVKPKWKGQDQVVAALVTAFMEFNGKHPRWILPGEAISPDLTPEQERLVIAAQNAPSLDFYAEQIEPLFEAALRQK